MKKTWAALAAVSLLTSLLLTGQVLGASGAAAATIEDNERGWANEDIRFANEEKTVLHNSVFLSEAETKTYDRDGDNFSLAWNYAIKGAVNPDAADTLVKNLTEPVVGGTLSFAVWVRTGAGITGAGLKIEAVAYEADGTAHALGQSEAMTPKAGAPTDSEDDGWYAYAKPLPAGKKIVKVELRLTNGGEEAAVWGMVNIDSIVFSNTVKGSYTRIAERGWQAVARESQSPTVAAGALGYSHEGDGVLVLSGAVTPDLEYLKSIGMSKTLDAAVSGDYLEYKVYLDTVNSSLPAKTNPHFKTKAIVYDENGQPHDLGVSDSILRYGAFLGGGMVYGGWNQYRVALPAGISVSKIEVCVVWVEEYAGMGPMPFYFDDFKVLTLKDEEPLPPSSEEESSVPSVPDSSEESSSDSSSDPEPQPVGPETKPFTPDDLTSNKDKRETVNDNECNWYTEKVLYAAASTLLDGSRIFDYDPLATEGSWQSTENRYVRQDTDDAYAAALMFRVGHPVNDNTNYDIVYKDLQKPLKGGTFSFYLWLRNGLPTNHGVFAVEALAYDKDGNAYSLGRSDLLGWSGDERYFTSPDDPNVAAMAGWHKYEGVMPKDVEIVRMGIMLVKPDPASTGCIGPSYDGIWPGEDWTPVDEIRFTDTIVCDDAIRMDDETLWESDEITITEMGEFLNPWCMMDDKAVELDCTFNKAPFGKTATLYREFETGIQGGAFTFSLYNPSNSYLATEPRYTAGVIAYDKDGNKIDLGDCTPGDRGYLKFSGLTSTAYQYNGYNTCTIKLPEDKAITRLEIVITETTGKELNSALLFLDNMQFIGTRDAGVEPPPSVSSEASQSSGSEGGGTSTPDTGENLALLAPAALLALLGVMGLVLAGRKREQ